MPTIVLLNLLLGTAVTAMVICPLVWAIVSEPRDAPAAPEAGASPQRIYERAPGGADGVDGRAGYRNWPMPSSGSPGSRGEKRRSRLPQPRPMKSPASRSTSASRSTMSSS